MSELYAPVVSICLTKRRRFAWAAWWTHAPCKDPFRRPDAHGGGARTPEAAHAEAEALAGMALRIVESSWSRAWTRVLVGQPPFPQRPQPAAAARGTAPSASVWSILGIAANASVAEVKRAFKQRSLQVHPDHGGTDAAFRELVAAYAEASKRAARPRRRT